MFDFLKKNFRLLAVVAVISTPAWAQTINQVLGSAAYKNIGTSGSTVPLLNGINFWANGQTFNGGLDLDSPTPVVNLIGSVGTGLRGFQFWNTSNNAAEIVFNYTSGVMTIGAGKSIYTGTVQTQSGTETITTVTTDGLAVASGKALKLGNAYVNTPVVTTGYLIIQDSTGTNYKIPACLASGC